MVVVVGELVHSQWFNIIINDVAGPGAVCSRPNTYNKNTHNDVVAREEEEEEESSVFFLFVFLFLR